MELSSSSAAGDSAGSSASPIERSHARERQVGRLVVTGLSALAIAQTAYTIVDVRSSMHQTAVLGYILYGACIVAAVLAALLAWRSAAASGALALAVFLALLATAMSHAGLYAWSIAVRLPTPIVELLDLTLPGALVFMMSALVRFSALFPDPLAPSSYPPRALLRGVRIALLRPAYLWGCSAALFATAATISVIDNAAIAVLRPVLVAVICGAMLLTATNLRLAYRNSTLEGRRRTFWVVEGFIASVAIFTAATLLKAVQLVGGGQSGGWYILATISAFIVLLVCLTIAMFFSGALDPSLAIKRTAIYSLMGIALVFVFVAVENAVQDHLKAWLHWSDSTSGVVIGGTVALTVEPIKHQVSRLCEHLLSRWAAPRGASTHAVTHHDT